MFKGVTYLTDEQYNTLITHNTLTVGDVTIEYDENMLYVTPDNIEYLKTSGGVITGDLTINGNITQQGNTYITHAEQVYSKNDYIRLRDGNTGGLAEGEFSGFEFNNYDSEGHSGRLVVDKNGVARVGDVGDEQPLATREETPIAGGFAVWDANSFKFKTTTDVATDTELKNVTDTVGLLSIGLDAVKANYVTTDTQQQIDGLKIFSKDIELHSSGARTLAFKHLGVALKEIPAEQTLMSSIKARTKENAYVSSMETYKLANGTIRWLVTLRNNSGEADYYKSAIIADMTSAGTTDVKIGGTLRPWDQNTSDLGGVNNKWKDIYFSNKLIRAGHDLSFTQLSSGQYQGTQLGADTGHGRITDINFNYSEATRGTIRHDAVSSAVLNNRPKGDGYLTTYFWDSTYKAAAQICLGTAGAFLQYRGMYNDQWSEWKTVATTDDFANYVSKPNLLTNSSFIVNRRGRYSSNAGDYGALSDIWRTSNGRSKVSLSGELCTILQTSSVNDSAYENSIYQCNYLPSASTGKTLCVSFKVVELKESNTTNFRAGVLFYDANKNYIDYKYNTYLTEGLNTIKITVPSNASYFKFIVGSKNGTAVGDYITFTEPKVEISDTPTPYVAKSYGEELIDCLSLLQFVKADSSTNVSTNKLDYIIPTRVNPAIFNTTVDGVQYKLVNAIPEASYND
jgi:hypothetical protein